MANNQEKNIEITQKMTNLYVLVLLVLLTEIVVFYLLTQYFKL